MALQILRRLRRGLRRSDLGLHSFDNLLEGDSNQSEDELLIQPMFDTYRALIEQIPKPKALAKWSTGAPTTVVLTGSTGTVGTFLLRALLDRPEIIRACLLLEPLGRWRPCHSRAANGRKRNEFGRTGLPRDFHTV